MHQQSVSNSLLPALCFSHSMTQKCLEIKRNTFCSYYYRLNLAECLFGFDVIYIFTIITEKNQFLLNYLSHL